MGSYLNPGDFSFRGSLRSKIYVDKSELIARTNEALCTEQKYICVSRPRRFGKSMAANMLAAYYDRSEHTEEFDAMLSGVFDNYWNQTETYEALKSYIKLNYDGLKDAVVRMLAGDKVQINTGTFSNDMTNFQGKDDVLTLLIHLGYLSYHWPDKTVTIPNKEVSQEYINAISTMDWSEVR